MGNFSILIQFRFLYIYILIYMVLGYFYESKLKLMGYYSFLERYFGIFIYFIIFVLILNIFSYFIKCKKKKMVYEIRVKFFILLTLSAIFLWGMYRLELPFEKIFLDEEESKLLIEKFFYQYKLGLILTYIFNTLLKNINFFQMYILLYITIFISLFFIVAKRIRTTIKNIIHNRKERKRLELERKLIQEQIDLMEALERKEKEKMENDTSF